MSQRLAEYVVGTRFEDLPGDVVQRTKDLIVFHLALTFAGRFMDSGRHAVALAHELSAGAGGSTIVGQQRPATMLDAIFAHSELFGNAEDDRHLSSKLRPARVAHPVAWVLGERERLSGRELIAAVVVGYDVACRLGEAHLMAGDYVRIAHKIAFAPFAAAAVAARLLRQDERRATHTIARAAHYGMGETSMLGVIARNGVMAALLPAYDVSVDMRTIEGPHGLYTRLYGEPPQGLEVILARLGREFAVLEVTVPRYPGSASHLAALEQGMALRERAGLRGNDVASLVATLPAEFRGRFEHQEAGIDGPNPGEPETARSLRLKLAILLLDGAIVAQPTIAHLRRPDVRAILPKVTLAFDPRPIDTARIEIVTKDARTVEAEGSFSRELASEWSTWLRKHGARFLSDRRLDELERLLRNLEDVKDVGEILRHTVPDRGA